jgi:CheY-like chemotaxis protein
MPIVLTSASVLTFNLTAAAQAGSQDFLPKPFANSQLIGLLTQYLGLTWREEAATAGGTDKLSAEFLSPLLAAADAGDITALRAVLQAARAGQPSASSFIDQLEKHAAAYQLERVRELLRAAP